MNRMATFTEYPPFPQNMLVEITNACNHSCIFCAHKKMNRIKRFCDRDNMARIIKEAYSCGTREIGFYLAGEPFLSKDLEFYVDICKKMRFECIYLTTNGVFATADRVYKLWKLGLSSIKFSVDAGTRETYQKIHGKDDFEIVIKNIHDIVKLKDKGMDLELFASYCVLKSNKDEIGCFMDQVGKLLDDLNINEAKEQCGNTPELTKELINPNSKMSMIPCDMIFNRLHVTCEGYLNACCLDMDNMLAIADLNKMHIKDAWNCKKMVELRKQHLEGRIGNNMCFSCIYGTQEKVSILPVCQELASSE